MFVGGAEIRKFFGRQKKNWEYAIITRFDSMKLNEFSAYMIMIWSGLALYLNLAIFLVYC